MAAKSDELPGDGRLDDGAAAPPCYHRGGDERPGPRGWTIRSSLAAARFIVMKTPATPYDHLVASPCNESIRAGTDQTIWEAQLTLEPLLPKGTGPGRTPYRASSAVLLGRHCVRSTVTTVASGFVRLLATLSNFPSVWVLVLR